MKIDRRSFLSLLIGGGAGAGLTPIPWKLTDDISIWTQMWPWSPVPEDGEVSYVNSVCTLCPGGCGITVRKIENRAVKIEGMKGHPVNDGGICILGLSGLQLLYGPTRVKTPLKRKASRGEGKWIPISWEDAVDFAKWLSQESGQTYRLPTEAEWEYAARSGSKESRFWGNAPDEACKYTNVADITAKQQWAKIPFVGKDSTR